MPDEKEENPKLCFCYSVFLAIKIFSEAQNNDLMKEKSRKRAFVTNRDENSLAKGSR